MERKVINTTSTTSDDFSALEAGIIDGTLIKEGKMIDPLDSMIAGIAMHKHKKIITRNIKDFSRIKGLKLERY